MRKSRLIVSTAAVGLVVAFASCRPRQPMQEVAQVKDVNAAPSAAEAPLITDILDETGAAIWQKDAADAPTLLPGKRISLLGQNFGPGPISAEIPATGWDIPKKATSGGELSKVLFGKVRALERSLAEYPGHLNFMTVAQSLTRGIDVYYEQWVPRTDTWVGDLISWSPTKIELTVPITAWEGPIVVWREKLHQVNGKTDYVGDIETGAPVTFVDPNTSRVRVFPKTLLIDPLKAFRQGTLAFTETYPVARVLGERPLLSNAVDVNIALSGDKRLTFEGPRALSKSPAVKTDVTARSAKDQYAYGEKIWWSHDWNLGIAHLLLGVDWDGIFGFQPRQKSLLLDAGVRVKAGFGKISGLFGPDDIGSGPYAGKRVAAEEGYPNPLLTKDGAPAIQLPLRDRFTGKAIDPYRAFGAIPLAKEAGASSFVAPAIALTEAPIPFVDETPYPLDTPIRLTKGPLYEGNTRNTGWVGYVYAEAAHPVPGPVVKTEDGTPTDKGEWIGFNCASCHSGRITYEIDAAGTKITKIFAGIPNVDWKVSFMAMSGRVRGLATSEAMPMNFIKADQPAGMKAKAEGQATKSVFNRFLGKFSHTFADLADDTDAQAVLNASKQPIDRSLVLMNMPRGTAEMTTLQDAGSPTPYANDYFLSPMSIPILTNHTPVRRALSHAEVLGGFEGAYLHGEEPDGARGAMTPRGLQDLTMFVGAMSQENEVLQRLGIYRWLTFKGLKDQYLGADVNEGLFVSFANSNVGAEPATFPPKTEPRGGLRNLRDLGAAAASTPGTLAARFPKLAELVAAGREEFMESCERCHSKDNFDTWTNEDMHPISAPGGAEPVGRYFAPSVWNRKNQALRVAILQNLFWVQKRGLLSDGHVHSITPNDADDSDALSALIAPDRCKEGSELYNRLYTINDQTFRMPIAGQPFTVSERGNRFSVPNPSRVVTPEEARFVERTAYFTKKGAFYYWDYQKMRREYGILEYGLDPSDPAQKARIGQLPAAPHPWCAKEGSDEAARNALVAFLLTL